MPVTCGRLHRRDATFCGPRDQPCARTEKMGRTAFLILIDLSAALSEKKRRNHR